MRNSKKGVMSNHTAVLITIFFAIALPTLLAAQTDKSAYEGKSFNVRKIVNHSNVFYLDPPLDTSMIFAQLKTNRLFLFRKDRQVEVTKMKIKDKGARIVLEIAGFDIGECDVEFVNPTKRSIRQHEFEALFNRVFAELSDSSAFAYYVVDTTTRYVHIRGANHVSRIDHMFTGLSALDSTEYRRCGACFRERLAIPNLYVEQMLAYRGIQEYRSLNPIVIYDDAQELIKRAGKRVLENWPLELRGYNYDFVILKNASPNACAFPAGTIYMHSGLLDIIESPEELDAVLAHEIGHVELRHGYRGLLKQQKSSIWGPLAGLLFGAAVGLATEDADMTRIAMSTAEAIGNAAAELAIGRYERNQELEADDMARLYLYHVYGDTIGFYQSKLLNKMKYAAGEIEKSLLSDAGASHPKVIARNRHLRNTKLVEFPKPMLFSGTDSLGRHVADIALSHYVYESMLGKSRDYYSGVRSDTVFLTNVYASVFSTEFLYDASEIKHFEIKVDGKKYKFDNKEDTPIYPLSQAGCVFECTSKEPVDFQRLGFFKLKLNPASEWTQVFDTSRISEEQ